ncbi:hypothetical protein H5410_021474 [Solanum commersonii]|uniref:Uncharacterized protein n=1 Tax=Solanum commersonii TaxID=4109 RepID=A0A9J5ZBG2_SOLCO|nr:hypothetical protein H5410_021474 [Solanum commersonii]
MGFATISKQAKNEESTRPKSKFLELKPFESSSSSKHSPNLELKSLSDHSASLVEIANQLGDPPKGFIIVLRVSTLEQKARIRHFGNSPNGFDDSQIFISSFFQLPLFLFLLSSVHAFLQTPNT